MYEDFDSKTQDYLNAIASSDPTRAVDFAASLRGSRARGWVYTHASDDYERALEVARGIAHPWYRCQALSYVATAAATVDERRSLIAEAFASALETAEPNRIVSVSAWPLELLCSMGSLEEIQREVDRLLAICNTESHSLRRCNAQVSLVHAFRDGPIECLWAVLDACTQSCTQRPGWRRDRLLRGVARLVDQHSHTRAVEIARLIDSPRFRQQALRWIGESD